MVVILRGGFGADGGVSGRIIGENAGGGGGVYPFRS